MDYHLSPKEHAALGTLARSLDCGRVRIYRSNARGLWRAVRALVLGLSGGRAVTLGNQIYLPDLRTEDLALLAHEVTHCQQFQRWGALRYFARGAVAQMRDLVHRTMRIGPSPYSYQVLPERTFHSYGMEQQAQIVEDCFRGYSPARTICPYGPGNEA